MLEQLLRNARNEYGELQLRQLETKLDMSREVAQTALALLSEMPRSELAAAEAEAAAEEEAAVPAAAAAEEDADVDEPQQGPEMPEMPEMPEVGGGRAGGEAFAGPDGPLIELLPEIRRTAVLSFYAEAKETVAEQCPLVGMLLKYAKETNGTYKCPLVQSASELGMDAHAAHDELSNLHNAGILRLELQDPSFYLRIRLVPSPPQMRLLTARLLQRMDQIERLQRTKLDASATLLWELARCGRLASGAAGGAAAPAAGAASSGTGAATEHSGCGGAGGGTPEVVLDILSRYFADDSLAEAGWDRPFSQKKHPVGLRGDVADFVATHHEDLGKSGAPLNGRAVARIFHRISSPSFPKKEWGTNRCWGLHRDVDFFELQRLADELLETTRRRRATLPKAKPARKRQRAK